MIMIMIRDWVALKCSFHPYVALAFGAGMRIRIRESESYDVIHEAQHRAKMKMNESEVHNVQVLCSTSSFANYV